MWVTIRFLFHPIIIFFTTYVSSFLPHVCSFCGSFPYLTSYPSHLCPHPGFISNFPPSYLSHLYPISVYSPLCDPHLLSVPSSRLILFCTTLNPSILCSTYGYVFSSLHLYLIMAPPVQDLFPFHLHLQPGFYTFTALSHPSFTAPLITSHLSLPLLSRFSTMPFKLRLKKTRQYNVLSRNVLVISVELLDKTTLECTLSADSTGQDCLHNVCQRLSLHQVRGMGGEGERRDGCREWERRVEWKDVERRKMEGKLY